MHLLRRARYENVIALKSARLAYQTAAFYCCLPRAGFTQGHITVFSVPYGALTHPNPNPKPISISSPIHPSQTRQTQHQRRRTPPRAARNIQNMHHTPTPHPTRQRMRCLTRPCGENARMYRDCCTPVLQLRQSRKNLRGSMGDITHAFVLARLRIAHLSRRALRSPAPPPPLPRS